jgi:hypothetical protein
MGNFAVEIPKNWHVQQDDSGLTARLNPNLELPSLDIQVCERTDPTCNTPCDSQKIKANYFYFSAGEGRYTFSQRVRSDGVAEFDLTGSIFGEGGDVQIASRVICSQRGIVFLTLASKESLEQLPSLQSIVATVRWLP